MFSISWRRKRQRHSLDIVKWRIGKAQGKAQPFRTGYGKAARRVTASIH